jgi:hypothetical protein
VGYREEFASGDASAGAYVCYLTIAAPQLRLLPGGPALTDLVKKVPLGFPDSEAFEQAGEDLKAALNESGKNTKALGSVEAR